MTPDRSSLHDWAISRQLTFLRAIALLIITLNPPFHLLLIQLPGIPTERFLLRVLPMIIAAAALLLTLRPKDHPRAPLLVWAMFTTQLCCTLLQVAESLNHPLYVAAGLTPIYAAQLAFVHLRHLVASLVGALIFYAALLLQAGALATKDLTALLLVAAACLISAILGALRIQALDQEFLARQDLAHAEAAARELAEQAQAASRAKSTFLANMSHELRTPLNAIIGYSELIGELAQDDGFTHISPDLDRITSSANHLLTLINDILDLSKIEAGKLDLVVESFDLSALLRELRDMAAPLAQRRHNTLVISPQDTPITLITDRAKLRQVLLNLLSNAAKFTDHGTITLDARSDGPDHVLLSVRDTGLGMSPEQLDKLFQPFVQVHDPAKRDAYGGTGLGLMLCRRFAQLMGGEVRVTSAPGQGSTFTVSLPRQAPTPAASPDATALRR